MVRRLVEAVLKYCVALTPRNCQLQRAKVQIPTFRPRPLWPTRSLQLHIATMCLLVFAWPVEPSYPLVVAPNRDERFDRLPVLFCVLQESGPRVLGGRDKLAGAPG